MASGSAYDGDDSPPIEDHDPDSPDTVLVTSANIMRFPTMNMDGTAPLPSAPARGELAHAQTPSAPVPNVGAGVPEPINLRRFCELLQVGSALRAPCASDDAHGFARPAHPTMPTALALRVRGMQPSSTTVQRQRQHERYMAQQQRLRVSVDGNEFHAFESSVDHPVDSVDTAAADTDDLDDR
jgi:hypothetical protein